MTDGPLPPRLVNLSADASMPLLEMSHNIQTGDSSGTRASIGFDAEEGIQLFSTLDGLKGSENPLIGKAPSC